MTFIRDARLDALIAMRDSDRPEDRDRYAILTKDKPTVRMSVGYYEADVAKHTAEQTE